MSTANSQEGADINRFKLNEFFMEINLILAANFSLLNRDYTLTNTLKALISTVPLRALHVLVLLNVTPSQDSMQSVYLIFKNIRFL